LTATNAGPKERAGFMEAPEIGPANIASNPTVAPMAKAAPCPAALLSAATAMITNMRKKVSRTSSPKDW
jgi:hypothetical protein